MALRFPAFEIATLRQGPWLRATDGAFSTWVKLCCRCAEDENGGALGGARTWDERMWLVMANVTPAGIEEAVAAGLCCWDGDTLIVMSYDQRAQTKVQTLRNNGDFGHLGAEHGKKGGRPRSQNPQAKPPKGVSSKPPSTVQIRTGADPVEQRSPEAHASAVGSRARGPGGASVALVRAQGAVAGLSRRADQSPAWIGSAAHSASVAAEAPRARAAGEWEGHRWIFYFGQAWCTAKGTVAYGRGGVADTRAAGDLMEMLGSLPSDEVLAIQARGPELFGMFLAETGQVAEAEHPFSWFVTRFNGYRARMVKRAAGGFARSEMPEGA